MNQRVRWTQVQLNHFFKSRGLTYKPLELDGDLGPHTERNIRHARYYLGLGDSLEGQSSKITDELIKTLKDPRRRIKGWSLKDHARRLVVAGNRQRARKREVKAAKAHGNGAGAKASAWLSARHGWTESPPGSNDAPFLAHWRSALDMGWMKGQPWCGFADEAAYHYAAHKELPRDTPSTIAIASRARRGDGFTSVPFSQVKVGDLVVFDFGSGTPQHVGIARANGLSGGCFQTVEGNTSAGSGGSQSNGGGVFKRTRAQGLVHTVARPK